MIYCRIDLQKTKYKEIDYKILDASSYQSIVQVYRTYCKYKGFSSVLPIFIEELESKNSEVIGYYHRGCLIAFSLMNLYPSKLAVFAEQFAWDYQNPKLKLGYKSIRSECARYKRLGFRYLYIGEYNNYKIQLQGFETVGTLDE